MRSRSLILFLVAALLVGGTFYLAKAWLNAQRTAELEASPLALPAPAKSVLVARAGVVRGQILKPDDLAWQVWPDGTLDKSYILLGARTPESFAGWVARNPIAAGEPLTESKIIAPGNRGFLSAVLRPGMRAVSVPVTRTSGISGFVFPGDQVDLLITYTIPAPKEASDKSGNNSNEDKPKVAETVLQDVRVIAIDQRVDTKVGEPILAQTATLEVTPKQSEIIAVASEMGKLSLSLRSLVPAASDKSFDAEQPFDSAANRSSPDSPKPGSNVTFTVDSEVSPLLPKALGSKDNSETGLVTILRGGGKGADVVASQPAPKGS